VKSSVDGKYYLVQDKKDKQVVADELATIKKNIKTLVEYMLKHSPDKYKSYIEHLNSKLNSVIITENIKDFKYTSYSVNKGEELVFCMRSRDKNKNGEKHNFNLIMYVVLHEISHIACPEYGHTDLFKDIFQYITKSAVDIGIYTPIDFEHNPTEYCGMTINASII
jgi:hypothetical protein